MLALARSVLQDHDREIDRQVSTTLYQEKITLNNKVFTNKALSQPSPISSRSFQQKSKFKSALTVQSTGHDPYGHVLLEHGCKINEQFSLALSMIASDGSRTETSFKKYIYAFTGFFGPVFGAMPSFLDRLLYDKASAREAVCQALRFHNYSVGPSRFSDGSFIVRPPKDELTELRAIQNSSLIIEKHLPLVMPNTASVSRTELALILLSDCYYALEFAKRWPHQNPMKIDISRQKSKMIRGYPSSEDPQYNRREFDSNQFVLALPPKQYSSMDFRFYKKEILKVASSLPRGLELILRILADTGARISEPMSLNIGDWKMRGPDGQIPCPNKGSRGLREKSLHLESKLMAEVDAYVLNERFEKNSAGWHAVHAIASNSFSFVKHDADVLLEPLFISPRGNRVAPGLFREHYFNPAMKLAGIAGVSPHRLRHEHALQSLLEIHNRSSSEEAAARAISVYADIQGWRSGPEMVFYYAPQYRHLCQISLIGNLKTDDLASVCLAESPITPLSQHPDVVRLQRELSELSRP